MAWILFQGFPLPWVFEVMFVRSFGMEDLAPEFDVKVLKFTVGMGVGVYELINRTQRRG